MFSIEENTRKELAKTSVYIAIVAFAITIASYFLKAFQAKRIGTSIICGTVLLIAGYTLLMLGEFAHLQRKKGSGAKGSEHYAAAGGSQESGNNEHFDGFSPFNNKQANCDKENDQEQLQKLLATWETPYNGKTFGYQNSGTMDLPPLNPIKSYPSFNFRPSHGPEGEKIFNFIDKFNDKNEIQGYEVKLIDNNIITA